MATAAADVLLSLPNLKFRGLRAIAELAPFDGAHDQAERRIPYRDAAGHDNTGRQPYKFKAKLWFVETIEPGSFPELFQQWLEALEDGSSGDLQHPIRGKVRARVLTWSVDYSSKNRGGVTIDVEWTETVDNFDDVNALAVLDLDPSSVATAADVACAALGIKYPDGKKSTSLFDLVNQIQGAAFSASLSLTGALNQAMGIVGSLIDTVNDLDDPSAWQANTNLLSLWNHFADLQHKAEKLASRPIANAIASSDTTLDAIADERGNSVGDIMGLNLALLAAPKVSSGTPYRYYSTA